MIGGFSRRLNDAITFDVGLLYSPKGTLIELPGAGVTIETAFMAAGFAWQSELHWKEIDDTVNDQTTRLVGGYVQLGYFLSGLIDGFPEPLELAARYVLLDDDRDEVEDLRREFAFALNWFFSGHNNKLTAELGVLTDQNPIDTEDIDGTRFRLQWDISF